MKILIIRLAAIGDVLRVLSLAQAIRNRLPDARIDFAVSAMAREVVEGHEAIDKVQVWDRPESRMKRPFAFARYLEGIRSQHYDAVLDFHAVQLSSGLITGASCAPRRYGFPVWRCRNMSHLFTNFKVDLPGRYMNRMDEFSCLARPIAPGVVPVRTPIALTAAHRANAEQFWQDNGDNTRPRVIVHTPVGQERKRWPPERFARLADKLTEEDGVNVLFTCGPGQGSEVQAVAAQMRRRPVVAPEPKHLKDLAALIERADLFVSVDTGPMHIANAFGVPVVALFCNTYVLAHSPYWEPKRVLYRPMCKLRQQGRTLREAGGGLEQVDVDSVHQACAEMLASSRVSLRNGACAAGPKG